MSVEGPAAAARPATPGLVTAAAITTITAASLTGIGVLLVAVGYALMGRTLLSYFDDTDSVVVWFVTVVAALLALCALAVVAAVQLLRRRRWAWWVLLVLTPVTAVLGVAGMAYLLPLVVAAAAVAVFVMLLLPESRGWLAGRGQGGAARAT